MLRSFIFVLVILNIMFISATNKNVLTLKMTVVLIIRILYFILVVRLYKFVMNVCIKSYHLQFLSLEPVSKVLGNDCFIYRTSSWFDNVRTSENCYMEFMDCIKDAKVSNKTAPYYIRVLYACCVRY